MLQSSAGTLAAAYTFVCHGQVDLSEARIGIAWTLVGAVAGVIAVERVDPMVLKDLLPLVLLGIVLSNSNHMTLVHAICRYLNLSGLSQRSAYRHAPTTAKLRANVFTVDLAACSRFPGREHRRSRLG